MKKAVIRIYIILWTLLIVTLNSAHAQEALKLEIVYPEKDSTIDAYSVFFTGNTNPGANLRINNQKVKVYPNGGFVHVVELNPGTNVINMCSTLGNSSKKLTYTLYAPKYEKTLPKYPLLIDSTSIEPEKSIVYKTLNQNCLIY